MTSALRKRFSSVALVSFAVAAIQVLAAGIGLTAASAQTYPSQLVRIVVPFTPGSQTDILGRAYADKLQEIWKRDVIVENKPGLAGTATVLVTPVTLLSGIGRLSVPLEINPVFTNAPS